MANLDLDLQFSLTVNQKEISVILRALAGHKLKSRALVLARQLNQRLLEIRVTQLRDYLKQSEQALTVAREEWFKEEEEEETLNNDGVMIAQEEKE